MSNKGFFLSVNKGTPIQRAAMSKLKRWMKIKHFEYSDEGKYDILVELDNSSRRYKIVDAAAEPFNGYIAVAHSINGQPVDIEKQGSEFWVYKIGESFYLLPIRTLKELIETQSYRLTDDKRVGKDTVGYYLFPFLAFKEKLYKL